MFYVYVLKSELNCDLYIGSCDDLKVRLRQHNTGKVKSTKAYQPWILIYYEAYRSKKDIVKREKQLKKHAAKKDLMKHLKYSLEG